VPHRPARVKLKSAFSPGSGAGVYVRRHHRGAAL